MLEVHLYRKDHCDSVLVGGGNYFIVFVRAPRLNYARNPCLGSIFNIS